MGNFGAGELIIIAVLVMVIFGGRKLPELGKGLGQGLANFRRAVQEPQPAETREGGAGPESGKAEAGPESGKAEAGPDGDGQ